MPFIPNFSTSSFPTLRCVPTSVCLQTWLQPHSHQGRRLPGGEGSPKSVPVGFHLDIYPQPLLFRPGGEFIVGSRANIPPPARQRQHRGTVLGFQLRLCLWNTERCRSGPLGSKQFRKDKYDQVQSGFSEGSTVLGHPVTCC